eukprot:scaffold35777_cov58-Phaeocystis_antarctica.AAC.2
MRIARAGRGVAGEQERLDADGYALIRGEAARGSERLVPSMRVKLKVLAQPPICKRGLASWDTGGILGTPAYPQDRGRYPGDTVSQDTRRYPQDTVS